MNKTKFLLLSLAIAGVVQSPTALAYDQGDWIIRFGTATVAPDNDSDALWTDQTGSLNSTFVEANDNTQLGISATYMFSSNLGLEILAATPFDHDLKVKSSDLGGALNNLDVGSTKHLPPTISLQYYLMTADSDVQPYIGLGLNYTAFFDESLSSAAKATLDATDISLDNSFGLAAQLGVDFKISNEWSLNASAMWADIDTEATIKAGGGDALGAGITSIKVDTELDPWVYRLSLVYKF